ncbi:unnamed protein product [Periconia digitata]|uniref:Uncharacterized protein n=1 Tax=Periconia digitata TaxID=1303443 RepID=A0A9W4U9T9_9PLEO|nr:unnamed protein product [Periconia digitata]
MAMLLAARIASRINQSINQSPHFAHVEQSPLVVVSGLHIGRIWILRCWFNDVHRATGKLPRGSSHAPPSCSSPPSHAPQLPYPTLHWQCLLCASLSYRYLI